MRQVADNVFALGSRGHNFYLVTDGDDVTVIDAGCRREWSNLETGLRSAGLEPGQIAGFMITHVHSDHFGLAKEARSRELRVAVHQDDEERALGRYTGRFSAQASDLPRFNPIALWNMMPMLLAGVTKIDFVDSVETFTDGQVLDVPGRPVAIHTPGHTEGHTMFHCPDLGVLFTGDGLVTVDLLGTKKGPQMIRDVFNLDTGQARSSLDRVTGLEADLLLPGHGAAWAGSPADAVALALA
ncbi:MAG: MBL fold metallo-hydrolase [Acidimicrobiia bacterium]|jgi:glyoxylase-like metal-dependent hydrolase (beta-lactamase superfamily II)